MSRDISEYASTEALNNPILPADGGMPEGMIRSDVNLGHREMMGAFRRYYDAPEWIQPRLQGPSASEQGVFSRISATQFQINLAGVDLTGYFNEGRVIKIVDGAGAGTDLTTQVEGTSTFSTPLTTVNIKSTDSMDVAASDVYSYFSTIIRALALQDDNAQFFVPATADSAGINGAIAAADAVNGGTVLLIDDVYDVDAQIDFSGTSGNIRLLGAMPEVVLRESAAGAAITPLINVATGLSSCTLENLVIDKNTNSKTGTSIYIDNVLRPKLRNIQFDGGDTHVELGATAMPFIRISDCQFSRYSTYGVVTNGPTDTHSGHISNCRFNGNGVSVANAAGVKLSGAWTIDACNFDNVGTPSINHRGIWLWNETAQNGGTDSTITGNTMDTNGGTVGTMIEVGADFVTVSGNRVTAPPSGFGIYVNGSQAGQTITGVTITGNVCEGGEPIVVNQRATDIQITGNVCRPGSAFSAIQTDSDNTHINGNLTTGGTDGIEILANSVNVTVSGNHINNPTSSGVLLIGACDGITVQGNRVLGSPATGITVSTTAVDTVVVSNLVDTTATAAISDTGYRSNRLYNSFDEMDNEQSFLIVSAPDGDTPGMTQLLLPAGGGPGRYKMTVFQNGGNNATMHSGTSGDNTDATVLTVSTTTYDPNMGTAEFVGTVGDPYFSHERVGTGTVSFSVNVRVQKLALE